MRAERRTVPAGAEAVGAARMRALVAGGESVSEGVADIISVVREGGDAALAELVARLDSTGGAPIAVAPGELREALDVLDPSVRAGLETAIENVRAVAEASVSDDKDVTLPQGHRVRLREVPVRRAAVYVPGGRAPYPSTVVMGVVTARAAGVEDVVVCAPGSHPVILAACALCGADAVYRMGGAHAVAALAYGTPSIPRVDVIAGPGNLWVQEAKRQVSGDCGIDGFYGPSDVLVVAGEGADPSLVAIDLRAQAEHGEGTLVVAASADGAFLDEVAADLARSPDTGAVAGLIELVDGADPIAFADAFAPEHLELVGRDVEARAGEVCSAGCVFVGASGATAFGDYIAGSNHSLPTGGAARYASALSVRAFRRRVSEVHIGDAADALARAAEPVARAEGFDVHADSMVVRQNPQA